MTIKKALELYSLTCSDKNKADKIRDTLSNKEKADYISIMSIRGQEVSSECFISNRKLAF